MTDDERPSHDAERRNLGHQEVVDNALADAAARSLTATTPLARRRHDLYAQAAEGVLADLAAIGFVGIREVGELRRRRIEYKAAVPTLIDWLQRVSYLLLAEDIVRTLSVPFAKKDALPVFMKLFREPPAVEDPLRPATSAPAGDHLRWVIGNGLGVFAGPAVADELIDLAAARSFGEARTEIVLALPKTKDDRVPSVLLNLLDDQAVRAFAIEALGKMRYSAAAQTLHELLDDDDENVRIQARKALKRIGS